MKDTKMLRFKANAHGAAHAEAVVGFLEGEVEKVEEAARLVAACDECLDALRTQADLVAALRGEGGPPRERCLSAMRLAEMTPAQAVADSHLRECAPCRLEWLLARAEYPEEVPEAAPAGAGVPWVERVLAAVSGLVRPQVLVPVAAGVVVVAVAGFLWFREPPVFPYKAWSGDASFLDQMVPKGAPKGTSPGGLAFGGGGGDPEVSAFRVGFGAGLVRDLYRQDRDSDAVRTYRLVVEGSRLKLDPVLAAEFVRQTLDPCVLPGVPYPDLCRLGIVAYGLARTGLTRGWLTVDVPPGLRDTVVRLHSRFPVVPPEARAARPAPPGSPEAFGGILLDLFRF